MTTGDGARPRQGSPHVCSMSLWPGTARWGCRLLPWRLGIWLQRASSRLVGLGFPSPHLWAPGPPLPPTPISSGEDRSGYQHPKGLPSPLLLSREACFLASRGCPHHTPHLGLCVSIGSQCGAQPRWGSGARFAGMLGPAVPTSRGRGTGIGLAGTLV